MLGRDSIQAHSGYIYLPYLQSSNFCPGLDLSITVATRKVPRSCRSCLLDKVAIISALLNN